MSIDVADFEFAFAERFADVLARQPIVAPNTPRGLAKRVTAVLPPSDSAVSMTARAFYRVRRVLGEQLGIEAKSILPGSRLSDLMPDLATRRVQWARICATLDVPNAPRLVRSESLSWTLAIGGGAAALAGIVGAAALTSAAPAALSALTIWGALQLTR